MKFIEYPSRDVLIGELADRIAGELRLALSDGGTASLAVPGGNTPGPVFDKLGAVDIEWDRITVLPTDERWVAESSEHSNSRMIRQRLLVGYASEASFLPVFSEAGSIEERIDCLDREVRSHLPLSVVMLGMGADMHTASLFPGSESLPRAFESDAPAFVPVHQQGGGPVNQRISMTFPVLNGARRKHLMIVGAEKLQALERAKVKVDPMQAPVSVILPDTTVHWAE